jgi:hypothetical protein
MKKTKIKVILDTNILISGIYWDGNSGKIISLWLKEKIEVCFSPETLAEFINKLADKFQMPPHFLKEWQEIFEERGLLFLPSQKVRRCRDKKDNLFLELALISKADFLITGDKDLLVLKKFHQTKIVKPGEFLNCHRS